MSTPAAAPGRPSGFMGKRLRDLVLAGAVAGLLAAAPPASAETVRMQLLSGDVVSGEVLERNEKRVVLQHPVLGRLEIPVEQLSPASTHPGLLGTGFLAGWTKEVDLGLSGSQGDTDEADLRIAISLDRTQPHSRWQTDARYELGYSDGDIDEHDVHATALHDWLYPPSRWFAFAYGLYDYDEFEAWEHRLTLGLGPAYRLMALKTFTLDARVGPFLTYEFGEEDHARPELGGGLFAKWTIREAHSLSVSNAYLHTLDQNELRNITRLEWKIRPAYFQHISLKTGLYNEYDSASRKSANNLNYYTSLALDF